MSTITEDRTVLTVHAPCPHDRSVKINRLGKDGPLIGCPRLNPETREPWEGVKKHCLILDSGEKCPLAPSARR